MMRFRKLLRREILFKLYKAEYFTSSVWHFWGAREADKLEALNKRILRFIIGDYSYPYTTLLSKVNSTSWCNKRVQNFLILAYNKLCFAHFPAYMKNKLSGPLPMIFAATIFFHLVNLKELPTILTAYFSARQWNALPDFFPC